MEWMETTASSVDEAKASLVRRLGVAADEVEFETLEEPRTGMFGRVKGEARVRARVTPKTHQTTERRQRPPRRDRNGKPSRPKDGGGGTERSSSPRSGSSQKAGDSQRNSQRTDRSGGGRTESAAAASSGAAASDGPAMGLSEVAAMVDSFLNGLVAAAELDATTDVVETDEGGLEATIDGTNLGSLIGPGGRTLLALQDLCRTVVQRHATGAEQTRLTLDIAGFSAFREAELATFVANVVAEVRSTGRPHVFEQMTASDRRLVHEAVADVDDIVSSSIGEEPNRQVMLSPAE